MRSFAIIVIAGLLMSLAANAQVPAPYCMTGPCLPPSYRPCSRAPTSIKPTRMKSAAPMRRIDRFMRPVRQMFLPPWDLLRHISSLQRCDSCLGLNGLQLVFFPGYPFC
jgi:hypothetical protein